MNSLKEEMNCLVWFYIDQLGVPDFYPDKSLYGISVDTRRWLVPQLKKRNHEKP